jgi:hypothetical protein
MRCHSVGLWFLLASRCTPALKTSFHAMKLVKTLGTLIIVIALLLLWHHFLISSRRLKLKAWESCKTKILDDWAARRGEPFQTMLGCGGVRLFEIISIALERQAQRIDLIITTVVTQQSTMLAELASQKVTLF